MFQAHHGGGAACFGAFVLLLVLLQLTFKPVQPNFHGTDFPDALDTVCIRLFRFNITFLPAGRITGAYYR